MTGEHIDRSPPRSLVMTLVAVAVLAVFTLPATAAAPAERRDARREMTRVRIEIERELRARPEMKQAKREWIDRRGEYNELKRAVIETLLQDSRYLSLRAEMWALQDQIDALRKAGGNGTAPSEEITALALDVMDLGAYLSVMERRALARHHAALEAKEAYLEAGRRLLELRHGIAEAIREDPRFRSARRALGGASTGNATNP